MMLYATPSSELWFVIRRINSWVGSQVPHVITEKKSIPVCPLIVFLNCHKYHQINSDLRDVYRNEPEMRSTAT